MLTFLKKTPELDAELNIIYTRLLEEFGEVPDERKACLDEKFDGYFQMPYVEALKELTTAETLYLLTKKWELNNVFADGKFKFQNKDVSVLARTNAVNSSWIRREGHDIKLINLAGLGDNGNKPGTFIDWLKQLVVLPCGRFDNKIYSTTIYLLPFHPREFGCAYLPKSSEVSFNLLSILISECCGLNVKQQVQVFIRMAQLAGHPVIYDILPQTGRFSKAVLANPEIARWFDIPELQAMLDKKAGETAASVTEDTDDMSVILDIYRHNGTAGELSDYYKSLYDGFEAKMVEFKREFSQKMLEKPAQLKIQKKVKALTGLKRGLAEEDITNQAEVTAKLIKHGLWPAPGGAWCSAGVPVYDRMSECGGYPTFKHFDYKGEDVTCFANLDCQTPYYFAFLENGRLNEPVVKYFIDRILKLQAEYNFDGFRVDHVDHVVDRISEHNGMPVSYRTPRAVLGRLNRALKAKIPYFATLAEYMLWDNYYTEYHRDMGFDLLWGNDIVSQFEKNPEKISEDNRSLTNYNTEFKRGEMLSILKTYNNQDGEFSCIDQFPGQLTPQGALFKWFKYKFLPGGRFAQRPVLYADGDESFTERGIEYAIGNEVSMPRGYSEGFYEKFNAIDKFVKSEPVITDGESRIMVQEEDGFAAWLIVKEPQKTAYLAVCNYRYPEEKVNGCIVRGKPVFDKALTMPSDYTLVAEHALKFDKFEKIYIEILDGVLRFDKLENGEFRVFELKKA